MSPRMRVFDFNSNSSVLVLLVLFLRWPGANQNQNRRPRPLPHPCQISNPLPPPPRPSLIPLTLAPPSKVRPLLYPRISGRATGDWDAIAKRGYLRVLVIYSKSGFFYDRGRAQGFVADGMTEFENVISKKLKKGARKFKVLYIPLPPGQLQKALNDGLGDVVCAGVIITPEREKIVDFTVPLVNDVKLVVVTSKTQPATNSIDDLSGRDIYVNSIAIAKTELDKINQSFKQAGKPEIGIKPVDPNLTEEDLLQMVNAGLIPATVATNYRAELWSRVYSNLSVTPVAIKEDGAVGWAMRKNSPQLKAVLDDLSRNTVEERFLGT